MLRSQTEASALELQAPSRYTSAMRRTDNHDRWKVAEEFCRQRLRSDAEFDVASYLFDCRIGWLELIKSLRSLRGVGVFEAQKEALQNERWRAWALLRIKEDPACAKEARSHIHRYADTALI